MFAVEIGVDRQRERREGDDDVELEPVDQRLERPESRPLFRAIAHRRGPAEREQRPQMIAVQEVPQQQPVAAFEVRVGARFLVGRNRGEIRLGGAPASNEGDAWAPGGICSAGGVCAAARCWRAMRRGQEVLAAILAFMSQREPRGRRRSFFFARHGPPSALPNATTARETALAGGPDPSRLARRAAYRR